MEGAFPGIATPVCRGCGGRSQGQVPLVRAGSHPAQPRRAADCLQRPLVPRSRFQRRLKPSVSRRRRDKGYHTMSDLKDLADSINLPKTILERADAFLRVLLGPATTEAGELLADRIRFRRFRNQVRMLQ